MNWWLEVVSQVGVALGAAAIWKLGENNRWGFVIGLAAQPFWFYTAIYNRQWGVLVAAVIYTVAWTRGVIINFGPKNSAEIA